MRAAHRLIASVKVHPNEHGDSRRLWARVKWKKCAGGWDARDGRIKTQDLLEKRFHIQCIADWVFVERAICALKWWYLRCAGGAFAHSLTNQITLLQNKDDRMALWDLTLNTDGIYVFRYPFPGILRSVARASIETLLHSLPTKNRN